ncbi:MAG: hypothetical protein V4565_03065 [Bacteroidota bacterium]
MKKQREYILGTAFIYLMLGIYTFGLVKPVIPLVKDIVAHSFFESSHMASVHYENGRYHIHLELKEEVKNTTEKAPVISEKDNFSVHVKSNNLQSEHYFLQAIKVLTPYLIASIDLFTSPPFIPPKA